MGLRAYFILTRSRKNNKNKIPNDFTKYTYTSLNGCLKEFHEET